MHCTASLSGLDADISDTADGANQYNPASTCVHAIELVLQLSFSQ